MYIVNVNNFRPFDLFILLNAAFRNSNIAFSHAALDICLRCAYNALKQTAWVPPDPVHMRSNKRFGNVLPAHMETQKQRLDTIIKHIS